MSWWTGNEPEIRQALEDGSATETGRAPVRPPALIDPKQAEKTFQRDVEKHARSRGWLCYHTWASMKSSKGFPDLVMLRKGRLVVAELKAEGKEATEAQDEWLAAFRQVPGVEVHLWHPGDWAEIERVLR